MNDQEEINYFKDYFTGLEQNDINNNNDSFTYTEFQEKKFVSKNNNIFNNNNLHPNSFNNKSTFSNDIHNTSLSSSFNSYLSTNQGNNSFSPFNSMSSINTMTFPLSFQYKDNLRINSINNNINNNNQSKSDNQLKINSNSKMTKEHLLEMPSENLFIYLTNQEGSRQGQNIINKMKENEVDILLNKIFPYLSEIFKDKYGNYFSKKLIQIVVPNQRIKLIKNLENNFILLSKSLYGTHPIQFLVETINMFEEKNLILNYIINNPIELALDQRGNCVLKKFIISTKDEERKELNKNLIQNIDKLILNQYGVIILISLIKHSKDIFIHKQISDFIINNNPIYFIRHPYSNYVVQGLLIYTDLKLNEEIIKIITNNYLVLSLQKNSNKVVENCIKFGKRSIVKKIFKDLLEKNNLECLLNNYYGNFVLEKLIVKLTKEEKNMIIKKIEDSGKIREVNDVIINLLNK